MGRTAAVSYTHLSEAAAPADTTAAGKVYFLNFKPEQDEACHALAKTYTEESVVPVTVVTAASGQYETTLMSEMAKSDAPTLFQVNGPVGLANWKDYCYDLTGSKILGDLTSDSYALKDGDATVAIGYVIESYGLITNKTLLEKAGYTTDDIKSFADLKKVAEDITARKDELGFAAFTSAGMDGSSDWRFKTHLANLPIYFEYQADGINNTDAIKGTYLDNYKDIFDLYINNSTCDPAEPVSYTHLCFILLGLEVQVVDLAGCISSSSGRGGVSSGCGAVSCGRSGCGRSAAATACQQAEGHGGGQAQRKGLFCIHGRFPP